MPGHRILFAFIALVDVRSQLGSALVYDEASHFLLCTVEAKVTVTVRHLEDLAFNRIGDAEPEITISLFRVQQAIIDLVGQTRLNGIGVASDALKLLKYQALFRVMLIGCTDPSLEVIGELDTRREEGICVVGHVPRGGSAGEL
jgi:hypothetical protein